MKNVWGIHTKNENFFIDDGIIALGWKKTGDITKCGADKMRLKAVYKSAYPEAKKGNISVATGMLYRFVYEAKRGDYIVYPSGKDRMVHIGQIEGEYRFSPEFHDYVHRRDVKWIKHFPRVCFSQGALYELGTQLSFFAIKSYADEFISACEGARPRKAEFEPLPPGSAEDILESTKDYIINRIYRSFKGYDFETLVANLLEAMGYAAHVSPRGGDSGIDIAANMDTLSPGILVQVKSQRGNISEAAIQSFRGALHEGEYGVFVTLSDFSKNARRYLDNSHVIKGINGNEFAELFMKYYERLDEKYRSLIPLKMVYIPIAPEDGEVEK